MSLPGLALPTARYYVTKTGLPFFDAARLWGACHLLFGTAIAEVRDEGAWWTLEGYRVQREAPHLTWVRERLERAGLERVSTALARLEALEDAATRARIDDYFATPVAARHDRDWDEDSVGRYHEPALLQGSRGPDSFRYALLASEKGTGYSAPLAEVVTATLGICLAAVGSSGEHRLLILPIPAAEGDPVPMGPFLRFHHEARHPAGGITGPIALALHVLHQVADRLPIRDFAYARHGGRGFYESGYLGLHGILRRWYDDEPGGPVRAALLGAGELLRLTQRDDEHAVHHLARAVAGFIHDPSLDRLEMAVRLRWRAGLAAEEEGQALRRLALRELWSDDDAIEGVIRLASGEPQGKDELLQQASVLARNVAAALRAMSGDSDRAWVGWYMRLENAPNAERFFREVERLKARARIAVQSRGRKEQDYFFTWQDEGSWLPLEVEKRPERYFRLFRSAFLLEVQNQRQRQLWREARQAEREGEAAS